MMLKKVLIFGATGAVGRAAALEAHRRGAEVTLAVRDLSKTVAGSLSSLPRLQADLTDELSIKNAVEESGARTAFVYVLEVDMTDTFKALKEAGITYVVLLSSWTIYPLTAEDAAREAHAIPKKHARAEIACQKAGLRLAAIRPLYFASNVLYESQGIQNGDVEVLNPDGVWDYIAPEDIGTVAGAKLVTEPQAALEVVDIAGKELISQREAWNIIGQEICKVIKVTEVDFDQFVTKSPGEMAMSLALGTIRTDEEKYPHDQWRVAVDNVKSLIHREPMTFREWVKQHKSAFEQ